MILYLLPLQMVTTDQEDNGTFWKKKKTSENYQLLTLIIKIKKYKTFIIPQQSALSLKNVATNPIMEATLASFITDLLIYDFNNPQTFCFHNYKPFLTHRDNIIKQT